MNQEPNDSKKFKPSEMDAGLLICGLALGVFALMMCMMLLAMSASRYNNAQSESINDIHEDYEWIGINCENTNVGYYPNSSQARNAGCQSYKPYKLKE